MITKTDFDAKLLSLNKKNTANKSKNLLLENEFKKLKIFYSSYFIGKSHFEEHGTQNYLVFQPIKRYFKVIVNTDYVSSSKSKRLSAKTIKPPNTFDNSLTPALTYNDTKTRVKCTGSCLKQSTIWYTHGKVVNIYIVYELGASGSLALNGTNSYLFVNGTKIYKFKAKDSEVIAAPLCIGNISKDWSADNMKKTGFNSYICDFSVDYDATDVDDIV